MHFIGVDEGAGDRTVVSIWENREFSTIETPDWAGKIAGVTEWNGMLIVACERAVFRYRDGALFPIQWSE